MKRTLPIALSLCLASAVLLPAFAGDTPGDLEARLARAELLAGLTEVEGPGIIVHLRHSRLAPKGVDPKALKVCEQDFNAILNVLRGAGAEALAIGGHNNPNLERVLIGTAAREGYESLLVNGTSLQAPYRILAIGDAFRMRTDLLKEGGVVKKAGLDVLEMVQLEHAARLALPAGRAPTDLRFARSGGSGETLVASAPEPALRAPVLAPEPQPVVPPKPVDNKIAAIVRRPVPGTPAPEPVYRPEPPAKLTPKAVVVAKAPVKPAPQAGGGAIFGGRGLKKFHVAGCRYGERIEAGQRVSFSSAKDAAAKGRTPCVVCQE